VRPCPIRVPLDQKLPNQHEPQRYCPMFRSPGYRFMSAVELTALEFAACNISSELSRETQRSSYIGKSSRSSVLTTRLSSSSWLPVVASIFLVMNAVNRWYDCKWWLHELNPNAVVEHILFYHGVAWTFTKMSSRRCHRCLLQNTACRSFDR